jgi:hypothetical protein
MVSNSSTKSESNSLLKVTLRLPYIILKNYAPRVKNGKHNEQKEKIEPNAGKSENFTLQRRQKYLNCRSVKMR